MYGWFHVVLDPVAPVINADEAEHSRQLLLEFIDETVQAYRVNPRRVYLLGFSQGAIIGLSVALTRPDKLAGLVAMSGRILPEVLPRVAPVEALRGLSIMVVHGTEDPVLPIHHARQTRDRLTALPVAFTYREYPIGHYVSDESLADVVAWLRQQLDTPSA